MFSKILALRLENVLPTIINMDQTGFIQNISSIDNVRRFLNIIHCSKSDPIPCVAVSLDPEKAFDRVEWQYLFETMERINIGSKIYQFGQIAL